MVGEVTSIGYEENKSLPRIFARPSISLVTTSNPANRKSLKPKTAIRLWRCFTMSKCRICEQNLVIELDPESFDEATGSSVCRAATALDDLLLSCGCHFHWSVSQLPPALPWSIISVRLVFKLKA